MHTIITNRLCRTLLTVACILSGALLVAARNVRAQSELRSSTQLTTRLVRVENSIKTPFDWGDWRRYFRNDTYGTRDMTVLAVTLKPGQSPHPPHQHAEEEFLILADGEGAWTVDGTEAPAHNGDIVYAAPWSTHGLKNTGRAPLIYYMIKWSGKSTESPDKPVSIQLSQNNQNKQQLPIEGVWQAEDRHMAMGSLYQPIHDTRQRKATVTFKQVGSRITGFSITPNQNRISGMERWKNGRTDFRDVQFSQSRLAFEFDLDEMNHGSKGQEKSKGAVRVQATLKGNRLVGTWSMFDSDGKELFRGEWEAERSAQARHPLVSGRTNSSCRFRTVPEMAFKTSGSTSWAKTPLIPTR